MGCCGPLPDESCGWPKGTVRAILAVVIVVLAFIIAAGMIVMLIIYNQITVAVGVVGTIFTVVGSVTAYYFSTQAAAASNKAITDAKDAEIARLNETQKMLNRGRLIRKKKPINHDPLSMTDTDIKGQNPLVIVE